MRLKNVQMTVGYACGSVSPAAGKYERSPLFKRCVDDRIQRVIGAERMARWRDLDQHQGGEPWLDPNGDDELTMDEVRRYLKGHLALIEGDVLAIADTPIVSLCTSTPWGWWGHRAFEIVRQGEPWLLCDAVEDFDALLPAKRQRRFRPYVKAQLAALRFALSLKWTMPLGAEVAADRE